MAYDVCERLSAASSATGSAGLSKGCSRDGCIVEASVSANALSVPPLIAVPTWDLEGAKSIWRDCVFGSTVVDVSEVISLENLP